MELDLRKILDQWYQRVTLNQLAHYEAAKYSQRLHASLGIASVIIPSIVGTALFGTITDSLGRLRISLGALCVLASILASLNTFLRLTTRAEMHLAAARQYGSLRRSIELSIAMDDGGKLQEVASRVVETLSELAREDPPVPDRIWRRLERQRALRNTEDLRQMATKEESIVSALRTYGELPIGFVTKLAGTSQSETLDLVERLREQRVVEVRGGTVSLTGSGGRHG